MQTLLVNNLLRVYIQALDNVVYTKTNAIEQYFLLTDAKASTSNFAFRAELRVRHSPNYNCRLQNAPTLEQISADVNSFSILAADNKVSNSISLSI